MSTLKPVNCFLQFLSCPAPALLLSFPILAGCPNLIPLLVLHGSISATLVDLVAGLAITSTGSPKTGLSTDLHVSFVGSAREGETLWIEGIAERVGATLAFTRVRIEKESSEGERMLVATGSHTKYVR
ncbi:hypothetical protein C8R47DRAFT_1131454 [Mycena vitilis]|nr:hypothetical protein C8R47DRAFT_1131454 [Mycena vitilis]